jgi:preprotein translocase subunit SecA
MLDKLIAKFIGTKDDREMKNLWPIVEEINQIWESFKNLDQADFPKKTEDLVKRIKEGEPLDSLVPEAFALVKETCRRLLGKKWPVSDIETTWNMVPFDVQLIGAIVLHQGKIAEMKTGEGKTLVATMPLYLNALTKRGAHLVTVNDYLARRDREWMGPIYEFLGLTVGCIQQGMMPEERRPHYSADITYGTNNEFGFDYLRDNMAIRWEDKVQRGHYYAIVDEVDSILIDEARTPLIISGQVETDEVSGQSFDGLTPLVKRAYQLQTPLVAKVIDEAEALLKANKTYEAGVKLLQARRGMPKNKQLFKIEQEEGIKKLIEKAELDFIRDKKFHDIDDELYFVIDEKNHTVDLTEKGQQAIAPNDQTAFVLPDLSIELSKIEQDIKFTPKEKVYEKNQSELRYAKKAEKLHAFETLLKAYTQFEKDVDYIVSDGKVIIVDEFTGRLMPGRRYSDGLHEALEAKENVQVQGRTQTLATITLQNYFRMYEKLAGMTGTAKTEANEFWQIYKLDVVSIPTNEPVRRVDYPDVVYKTRREKYNAVLDEIEAWHKLNRPILVGTTSVDVSETLSRMLRRRGINHQVLNAKNHQKEAQIILEAGEPGMVTIATNMAGRGTDIKLGKGVVKGKGCYITKHLDEPCEYWEAEPGRCLSDLPCGLYIIATERHESRRIDNQLRGRSGRQGDPGSSRFYLSLEDDLMRLFGSERVAAIMDRFGAKETEPIEHPWVTKAIDNAQKRVETRNFEIRKHLLEYDNMMNAQRKWCYELRDDILKGEKLAEHYEESATSVIEGILANHAKSKYSDEWEWDGIEGEFELIFLAQFKIDQETRKHITPEVLLDELMKVAKQRFEDRKQELGEELFNDLLKFVLLRTLDAKWRDHLIALDDLREGIGLRAYGQEDPLIKFKQEADRIFWAETMPNFYKEAITLLFRAQVRAQERKPQPREIRAYKPTASAQSASSGQPEQTTAQTAPQRAAVRVGRNEPCPCGSGKKYKKCCGQKQ